MQLRRQTELVAEQTPRLSISGSSPTMSRRVTRSRSATPVSTPVGPSAAPVPVPPHLALARAAPKAKKKSRVFTDDQRAFLEAEYARIVLPSIACREKIALEFRVGSAQVSSWFWNRRSRDPKGPAVGRDQGEGEEEDGADEEGEEGEGGEEAGEEAGKEGEEVGKEVDGEKEDISASQQAFFQTDFGSDGKFDDSQREKLAGEICVADATLHELSGAARAKRKKDSREGGQGQEVLAEEKRGKGERFSGKISTKKNFSPDQRAFLLAEFARGDMPTKVRCDQLGEEIGATGLKVWRWFVYTRGKVRNACRAEGQNQGEGESENENEREIESEREVEGEGEGEGEGEEIEERENLSQNNLLQIAVCTSPLHAPQPSLNLSRKALMQTRSLSKVLPSPQNLISHTPNVTGSPSFPRVDADISSGFAMVSKIQGSDVSLAEGVGGGPVEEKSGERLKVSAMEDEESVEEEGKVVVMDEESVEDKGGIVPSLGEDDVGTDAGAGATKAKPKPYRPSSEQLDVLVAAFDFDSKPSSDKVKELADEVCMPLEKVRAWFRNRRRGSSGQGGGLKRGKSKKATSKRGAMTVIDKRTNAARAKKGEGEYEGSGDAVGDIDGVKEDGGRSLLSNQGGAPDEDWARGNLFRDNDAVVSELVARPRRGRQIAQSDPASELSPERGSEVEGESGSERLPVVGVAVVEKEVVRPLRARKSKRRSLEDDGGDVAVLVDPVVAKRPRRACSGEARGGSVEDIGDGDDDIEVESAENGFTDKVGPKEEGNIGGQSYAKPGLRKRPPAHPLQPSLDNSIGSQSSSLPTKPVVDNTRPLTRRLPATPISLPAGGKASSRPLSLALQPAFARASIAPSVALPPAPRLLSAFSSSPATQKIAPPDLPGAAAVAEFVPSTVEDEFDCRGNDFGDGGARTDYFAKQTTALVVSAALSPAALLSDIAAAADFKSHEDGKSRGFPVRGGLRIDSLPPPEEVNVALTSGDSVLRSARNSTDHAPCADGFVSAEEPPAAHSFHGGTLVGVESFSNSSRPKAAVLSGETTRNPLVGAERAVANCTADTGQFGLVGACTSAPSGRGDGFSAMCETVDDISRCLQNDGVHVDVFHESDPAHAIKVPVEDMLSANGTRPDLAELVPSAGMCTSSRLAPASSVVSAKPLHEEKAAILRLRRPKAGWVDGLSKSSRARTKGLRSRQIDGKLPAGMEKSCEAKSKLAISRRGSQSKFGKRETVVVRRQVDGGSHTRSSARNAAKFASRKILGDEAVDMDPSLSGRRPKRIRKANPIYGSDSDSKEAGLVESSESGGAPPLKKRNDGNSVSGPYQKSVEVVKRRLTASVREKLNALPRDQRVSVIRRGDKKIIRSGHAPMRKNLIAWLAGNLDYDFYDEDEDEQVNHPGHVDVGKCEAALPFTGEPFRGQVLSLGLQQRLASMDLEFRVPMWDRRNRKSIRGRKAPKRKALDLYMLKHPDRDIVDPELQSELLDPLANARQRANEKADQLSEDVRNIMGSLRIGDPVAQYRMELETEVERVGGLAKAIATMRSGKFLEAASDFLIELQQLDILDVFGDRDGGPDLGFPSFETIRMRLENGDLGGMEDVWDEFLRCMQDLLDFFEDGSVPVSEAERMCVDAAYMRKSFLEKHAALFAEETALACMHAICASAFEQATSAGIDIAAAVAKRVQQLDAQRLEGKSGHDDSHRGVALGIVDQQQSVVKCKSNYRDEKGFSHLGKRQSAKVLSLALSRPDRGEAGSSRSGVNSEEVELLPESSCHSCRRILDDSLSSALCCTNIVYRTCRKSFCYQCATSTLRLSDEEFMAARAADVWICFHCRMSCRGRSCGSGSSFCGDYVNNIVDDVVRQRSFQLEWRHGVCELQPGGIEFSFARRIQSGAFFDFGPTCRGKWVDSADGSGSFVANCNAPLGAYRCMILHCGRWIASFCFQVLASQASSENKAPGVIPVSSSSSVLPGKSGCSSEKQPALVGQRAAVHFKKRHERAIRWSVAAGDESLGRKKDLPMSLRGESVRNCSRTEGYDWRGPKLFTTVKWKGDAGVSTFKESSISTTSAVIVDRIPLYNLERLELSSGCSIKSYEIARNTMMYQAMRDRQWGIVTAKSAIHGIGLYTMTGYNKGDFVIEYAGQLIRHEIGDLREVRYAAAGLGSSTYLFKLSGEEIVDATMKSNRARFLNHSCDSNMVSQIVSVDDRSVVVFVATRRVYPFAELTFDYQLPYEDAKLTCRCNSPRCPGFMN